MNVETLGNSRVLVVGPGWLGGALVSALREAGNDVYTLARSATSNDPRALRGDIGSLADRSADSGAGEPWLQALPDHIDHLVLAVAPSRRTGDSYEMYPRAAAGASALAARHGIPSVLYTSSTGVYDRDDGGDVTEETPIADSSPRIAALHLAERLLRDAPGSDVHAVQILRVAGLYGPGRDPAPRFVGGHRGEDRWCNFAWRDDVVSAATHLLAQAAPGISRVFNCADGVPVRASALTAALGGPVERFDEPVGSVPRGSRRVLVNALRQTGWSPTVPTVFDGLRRLGHAISAPTT